MKFKRKSGILLHPTSFPGSWGIGDLGPWAYRWIDFLAESKCQLWQVLPLGPTGYGDSPYQCFSAFAGNPYLISPDVLLEENLLHTDDIVEKNGFPTNKVDFGRVIPWKLGILDRAFGRFQHYATQVMLDELNRFRESESYWLEDYALFMALKETHNGFAWTTWEPAIRTRQTGAIKNIRQDLDVAIQRQVFRQFIFFRQWNKLRDYAHSKGISIIGDAPIFVAHDSSDVWAHPELFYLEKDGKPTYLAGVPPDYFAPTGQLWGNPLYNWEIHQSIGYTWWIERIKTLLQSVDIIRLDHFRGFAGYWEVPGDAKTAENGRWVSAPGIHFLQALKDRFKELPIIAEDLGVITPDVIELRDKFNLPGMKIFQFAFDGGPDNPFLPHHYPVNCVAYTGTHDNDTVKGWYNRVSEIEKEAYRRYLDRDGNNVCWDLIRGVWASVAMHAIAPMQDFLELGNEARMNYPGNPSGNWYWRLQASALTQELGNKIKELNFLYSRDK